MTLDKFIGTENAKIRGIYNFIATSLCVKRQTINQWKCDMPKEQAHNVRQALIALKKKPVTVWTHTHDNNRIVNQLADIFRENALQYGKFKRLTQLVGVQQSVLGVWRKHGISMKHAYKIIMLVKKKTKLSLTLHDINPAKFEGKCNENTTPSVT